MSRAQAENVQDIQVLNSIFFAFQLFGLGGLVLMLVAAVFSNTRRHPTWFNFCIVWILSCISYCFLVGRPTTYVPPHSVCFAQATLIYTVPSLAASATVALIIHAFHIMKFPSRSSSNVWTIVLLIFPYFSALAIAIAPLVIGSRDPETVKWRSDTRPYCNMQNGLPSIVSYIYVALNAIVDVLLAIFMVRDVKYQWNFLKATRSPKSDQNGRKANLDHLALAIRVFIFTAYMVVILVMCIILTTSKSHGHSTSAKEMDILLASEPLVVVLVFGTQKDLILTWKSGVCRVIELARTSMRR